MQPDDWERVQSVFFAVADLSPHEQAVQLNGLCGDDKEFRARVESLLTADHESEEVISGPIARERALLEGTQRSLSGDRLGAWRVVEEIGRGGMGTVYLAIRDDDQFKKHVAIKVVRHGMDTEDVLRRFRHERQILANLDHPNIARLLDGGTTPDGRPFFVMDYVEGRPLDLFCIENNPDIEARCRLFLRILDAVAYAHRNLVVHRDLKPANIFVKSDGTPKLLDFGVAKLLEGDASATFTSVERPFTPQYASPEQIQGSPVTTAVDIYALGAILYEMLTGLPAQKIDSLSPFEIERVICRSEVPAPSLSVPGLDADLDNIVLMAMRKEPSRRYRSVDQLAEDIRRHLDGRAVLARQDSFWYRTRKFARRYRLQISAAALIFASLVTALIVTLAQVRVARSARLAAEVQRGVSDHERARAEAEFHHAEVARANEAAQRESAEKQKAIADQQRNLATNEAALAERRLADVLKLAQGALFDVHDSVAKLPGSMAARQQIVSTTREFLEHLQSESGLTDEMRITLAAAYYKVAQLQGNKRGPSLEDFAGAEASLKKGKEIILPLYQRKSGDPDVMFRWIEIQGMLADLARQAGRDRDAVKMLSELLPVAHRLAQTQRGSFDAESQEADIEEDLALILIGGSRGEGLDHAERGAAMMRDLIARYPNEREAKQDLGSLLAAEAGARATALGAGELEKASEEYKESIGIREELLRENPQDTVGRRNLLVACGNYATNLGIPNNPNLGRPAEAQRYADKAVALGREEVKADPLDATARYDLGVALGRSGMVDPTPLGEEAALARLEEAVSLIEPTVKANPKSSINAFQLAIILEFKGQRLDALGREADAVATYRHGVDLLAPFLEKGQDSIARMDITLRGGLARALARTGAFPAALELANDGVARAEKRRNVLPQADSSTGSLARAYAAQAFVEDLAGDAAAAKESAEKADQTWHQIQNPVFFTILPSLMAENEKLLARLTAPPVPTAPGAHTGP